MKLIFEKINKLIKSSSTKTSAEVREANLPDKKNHHTNLSVFLFLSLSHITRTSPLVLVEENYMGMRNEKY